MVSIHLETDLLFKIINTVARSAFPLIKNQSEHNEFVIKVLKRFGFEPTHPPKDFDGVYAYTLVEYGVGKSKTILELFREEEIKQAFRNAFEQNNPSILLREGENFLDWNILGDVIKEAYFSREVLRLGQESGVSSPLPKIP